MSKKKNPSLIKYNTVILVIPNSLKLDRSKFRFCKVNCYYATRKFGRGTAIEEKGCNRAAVKI